MRLPSYPRVLRQRDFRYLFLGQSLSVIGDRVVVVALALFITERTGSPTDLGLVLGAQTLTLVLLLLFGGVWADRLPRRQIMIVTDAVRAALHALLAVLIFTGDVQVWEIVVIEALFGAAEAFFNPAYQGLVPQTVPESMIQEAKALTLTIYNVAMFLGPALATVLVLGIGAGEAFALDAATFLVSVALLLPVRARQRGAEAPATSVLRGLHDGWREVRSRAWVWVTIAVFAGIVLCVYAPWNALAPSIARDYYGHAGIFGLLGSATGLGALTGSLIALRWRPRRPLLTGALLTVSWPITSGLFALGAPIPVLVVSEILAGTAFALFLVWWETALAHHIPPAALSRVSAYDLSGSLALLPIAYLLAGPVAAAIGARTVLGVGSLIGLILLGVCLLPRETRELGSPPASAEQLARQVAIELGRET